jgi:hypothetical protein
VAGEFEEEDGRRDPRRGRASWDLGEAAMGAGETGRRGGAGLLAALSWTGG